MHQWQKARCERVELLAGAAAVCPITEVQQASRKFKVMVYRWTVESRNFDQYVGSLVGSPNWEEERRLLLLGFEFENLVSELPYSTFDLPCIGTSALQLPLVYRCACVDRSPFGAVLRQ